MNIPRIGIVVPIVFMALKDASSFVNNNAAALFGCRGKNLLEADAVRSRLNAVVFNPSWEGGGSYWDDDEGKAGVGQDGHPGLKDTLEHDREGSLAKVAAAFSPPGQSISLGDIEHLEVLNVDESHIEIVAVVCDKESCATHMVPVSFPTPCRSDGSMDGCVLDNVDQLSAQADTRLKEIEWTRSNEEDMLRAYQELTSFDQGLDFPAWWVPPGSMAKDCDDIQRVLNGEDFRTETKALGIQALSGEEVEVESAAVVAVCPAGIYLRVKAKRIGIFDDGKVEIIDVPFAFGGKQAEDASGLRDAVQGAVASAVQYMEKFF